jgi:signal peptidase I
MSRKRFIFETVLSLALALLIVFTIRSSFVEAFKIPSGSMIPTLLTGDHIFVNKFAYGLKVPAPER